MIPYVGIRQIIFAAMLLAYFLGINGSVAATPNLLTNGSFETAPKSNGVPPGWRSYVPQKDATFQVKKNAGRDGTGAVGISTTSDLAAILVSNPPTPVVPGEQIQMSVWCRPQDLKTSSGGFLAFSAGFQDSEGHYFDWHRTQQKAPASGDWVQFQTEATVPARAATMTFQIGIRQMTGTVWWDDAELHIPSQIAARLALPPEVEPGTMNLPVLLINRAPSDAGRSVTLGVEPGHASVKATLSRETISTVTVPLTLEHRGKVPIIVSLVDPSSGASLFTTSQTVTVPPLLRSEPLVPTHFCVEDAGDLKFEGRLWVHEAEPARSGLAVRCILRDRSGAAVATWNTKGALPPNPVTFAMSLPKTTPRQAGTSFVLEQQVMRGSDVLARAEQDWRLIHRADATVTMGEDGYMRVAGKPFFPVGLFMGGDPGQLAAAGFNFNQNYNLFASLPGENPNNEAILQWLDKNEAAGVKVLLLLSHGSTGRLGKDESEWKIRMFRNHPAVLCWYEEEAVARGIRPLSYLQWLYDSFKHEGPEHPVLMGDERDESTKIKDRSRLFPDEYMDAGIWWWYPIPLRASANGENYEGAPTGREMEFVPPTFLTEARTKKPIWVAVQCYKKPGVSDGRFPTPEEYRENAYLAVIAGAKGIAFYTGLGERGNGVLNKPEEGHWDYLKTLARELREMSPVFMSADAAQQATIEPTKALVSTRLKMCDGRVVLLAANRSVLPADLKIHLPGAHASTATVRYENRTVPVDSGGQIADRFAPYAVHVYEVAQ